MKKPITLDIVFDLYRLSGESIFVQSLISAVKNHQYRTAVDEIYAQSKDNRPLVSKLIGENLLTKIETLCGI